LPDLSSWAEGHSWLQRILCWLSDSKLAVRAYGATSYPSRGEFFTMGSDTLFRGFDMAQRQGSAVWVGSVEWRVPVLQRMKFDMVDHVVGLRNIYVAGFYDVGDAYTQGHQVGPIAHALGGGLRLDMAWFSFVERSTLRLDIAKSINTSTGIQIWFGINQPF
jgi:hemolysin activation/secretion protein